MRRAIIALMALAFVLGPAWAQDVTSLVAALRSDDADARMAALDELSKSGAPAIEPLAALIGGQDLVADRLARRAVQAIVQGATQWEADRQSVATALLQQAFSKRPLAARHWALRMLSFAGGDEQVPALATLLRQEPVREMARWALVRIPGQASLEALSEATARESDTTFRAALITGLGARGDARALPTLHGALSDDKRVVRVAAMDALGNIPDPAAERALRDLVSDGSGPSRDRACAAYLALAELLLAKGERAVAEEMYQRMYDGGATKQVRCAGLVGLARTQGPRAMRTLVAALQSDDDDVRATAKTALIDTDGLTDAIGHMVQRPPSREMRLALIDVLVARGDPAAVPALLRVAQIGDEEAQIAAIGALGELRRPSAATTLLLVLRQSDEGRVRGAAVAALAQIPGTDTTDAIVHLLATSEQPDMRSALARALGSRPHPGAAMALLAAVTDANEAVEVTALEALGKLGDPAAVPTLLAMLRMAEGDVREAALKALEGMPPAETDDMIAIALQGAPDDMRASLVRILGRDPDRSLLPTFSRSTRDRNETVAVRALEALGTIGDASVAPLLLDIAQDGTDRTRSAALKAYLEIADARRDKDGRAALAMYEQGLELATSDADRRAAIQGMGSIGDPAALPLIRPFLEGGSLQAMAANSVVPIADRLAKQGKTQEAIDLYTKTVELGRDRKAIVDAAGKLRELGVDVNIAAKAGFIGHWWVLGPFANRKKLMESDVTATDGPIDPTSEVRVDDEAHKWKYIPVDDPRGMLDMEKSVARRGDCGVYAYAEVTSDSARDVLFKIGSDDSVFCWHNGTLIHTYGGDRGYAPDQDSAETSLTAGTNTILMKLINNSGPWALGLRITDRDGNPLELKQRKP